MRVRISKRLPFVTWQHCSVGTDAARRDASWDPASWAPRTSLIVFAVGAVVVGVGISQAILMFDGVENRGRGPFLAFWAFVISVICVFMLLCMRMSSSVFRGVTVVGRRPGESQVAADARADAQAWRVEVAVVAFAGLLCFAFIVWQAIEHH